MGGELVLVRKEQAVAAAVEDPIVVMLDISLELVNDFTDAAAGRRLLSPNVGPAGEAILLLAHDSDAQVLQGHDVQSGWASFPHSRAKLPVTTEILIDTPSQPVRSIRLNQLTLAHPLLQPLPDGEILLVGARCRRLPDGTSERNAQVYSAAGELRRQFVLGDGIKHVQTTAAGDIWVGYFDEGVYGNYGWGNDPDSEPIGATGLVRFDRWGARLWEYTPPAELGLIDDCYALNVTDAATWAYYYSDFPLVCMGDGDTRVWRTEVSGAHAVAVDGTQVLFAGGYGADADRVVLASLGAGRLEDTASCRLLLPSGELVPSGAAKVGRGPVMHVFVGKVWYQANLGALQRPH